ncbi:hypothetical protein LSM04_009593 [Trypanosoma melophagium]|uniref:uncharacterized protein n=1 Tax=Trypanosoma melophagium TaxID=715481 RepID=UPI00351A9FD4|nr:hypothetical protein LSM04_009593 [Trypanosoma melophagium]
MQRVFRNLWLFLLGFLRIVLEVLLFVPRYLLLERHDHASTFWGTRAAPVLLFAATPWGTAVVRRIDALISAKNITTNSNNARNNNNNNNNNNTVTTMATSMESASASVTTIATNTTPERYKYSFEQQELQPLEIVGSNSGSVCTTPNCQYGNPGNDGDDEFYENSDIVTCDSEYGITSGDIVKEQQRQKRSPIRGTVIVIFFSFLKLLRSISAMFVNWQEKTYDETEKLETCTNEVRGSSTMMMMMMEDSHFLHGVFTEGVPFVDHSLLKNVSVDWDTVHAYTPQGKKERRRRRMEWEYLYHSHWVKGKKGVLSCWFRNKRNDEPFICVPYKPLLRRGTSSRSIWSEEKNYKTTNRYYFLGGSTSNSNSRESGRMFYGRQDQTNGFIPPWYAVHAKAQLLLSFLDPLWRIITEMFAFSDNGDETESHIQPPSSLTDETDQDSEDSSNISINNRKKDNMVGIDKPQSTVGLLNPECSYAFGGFQQDEHNAIPHPVEEICFFSTTTAKALLDRFLSREQHQEQDDDEEWNREIEKKQKQKQEQEGNAIPSSFSSSSHNRSLRQIPIKSSINNRDNLPTAVSSKDMEATLSFSPPQRRESGVGESSGTEEPPRVFTCGHRVTGVRWLHGSSPPEGPNTITPVVILLLCPSVLQGGEHGYVARRMGALCASLTQLAELRRESHKRDTCSHASQHPMHCTNNDDIYSGSGSGSNTKRGGPGMKKKNTYPFSFPQCIDIDTEMEFQNCNNNTTTTKKTTKTKTKTTAAMEEVNDVRFATWHAAVPVAEVLCWPADESTLSASHRERVPLNVEDVDHITRYLGKLRRITVMESETVGDAPLEFCMDKEEGEEAGEEPDRTSSASTLPPGKCSTKTKKQSQQGKEEAKEGFGRKTTTRLRRKVYIVGVGWSNASGPLLQYVMSYGAQSRMDGVVCINHTFSSNYTLTPESQPHNINKTGIQGEKVGGFRVYKKPFHGTFLSAPGGAVRLILLATRLQMVANHLRRRRRRHQLQQQQQGQKGKIVSVEGSDMAFWQYMRDRVSTAVSFPIDGSYQEKFRYFFRRRLQESPPPPITSTSAETPIEALLSAGRSVEREVSEWWLDELQPGNNNNNNNNNTRTRTAASPVANTNTNTNHTYYETDADPPLDSSSGRWHPVMSLADWGTLLQNRENVPAATLLAASLSRLQVSPPQSPSTPNTVLDSPRSPCKADKRRKHNTTHNHLSKHVDIKHIEPEGTLKCQTSSLFDMARGKLESCASSQMKHPQESYKSGSNRNKRTKEVLEKQKRRVKHDKHSHRYTSPDPTMMALRGHSSSSANLASLVRVPTLFVHARDDEIAPLGSLPLRALATNPKIFTVLTRRGGYGVFLEGISTLFTLPRLALQERTRRKENNRSNNSSPDTVDRVSLESKVRKQQQQQNRQRSWWSNWMQHEDSTARLSTPTTMGTLPRIRSPKRISPKKRNDKDDLETVFVIEGTTWMERLVVEFIAGAILTQSPYSETAARSQAPPTTCLSVSSLESSLV